MNVNDLDAAKLAQSQATRTMASNQKPVTERFTNRYGCMFLRAEAQNRFRILPYQRSFCVVAARSLSAVSAEGASADSLSYPRCAYREMPRGSRAFVSSIANATAPTGPLGQRLPSRRLDDYVCWSSQSSA